MEYINSHLHAFWFVVGFVLLAVELLVLGFATGFVLFLGLGALVTGGLIWFAVIPATWLASIPSFAISSLLFTALLWKPLKRLNRGNASPAEDRSSDLIGLEFRLESDITRQSPGKTRYSGIEWKVEIDNRCEQNEISTGSLVAVVGVDAGKFRVKPV